MSMNRLEIKAWIEELVGEPVIVGNPNICIYKTAAVPMKLSGGQLAGVVVFKEASDGPLKAAFVPFGMQQQMLDELEA